MNFISPNQTAVKPVAQDFRQRGFEIIPSPFDLLAPGNNLDDRVCEFVRMTRCPSLCSLQLKIPHRATFQQIEQIVPSFQSGQDAHELRDSESNVTTATALRRSFQDLSEQGNARDIVD